MKLKKIAFLFSLYFITISQTSIKDNHSPYIEINAIQIDNLSNLNEQIYNKIKDYKVITVGEIHGGQETPLITYSLANLLLKHGKKVIIGVEIPQNQQKNIDEYLATGNIEPITKSNFFNRKTQDGRSSTAMFELIKKSEDIKDLRIFCFDVSTMNEDDNRDKLMAENLISEINKNTDSVFITLSGNMHAALKPLEIEKRTFTPMGYYLYNLPDSKLKYENILSLNHNFLEGSSWNCRNSDCKEYKFSEYHGKYTDSTNYENYFLIKEDNSNGYKGIVFTKRMNVSYPLNYKK